MLYFWKVILKVTTFWPLFLTKLSQKHKIIFLNKMKLGTNPKKLFLHPKSNFTICEKNLQQLRLFLKSYDSFLIFLIFRFLGVLPYYKYTTQCSNVLCIAGNRIGCDDVCLLPSLPDWCPAFQPFHSHPILYISSFPSHHHPKCSSLEGEGGKK